LGWFIQDEIACKIWVVLPGKSSQKWKFLHEVFAEISNFYASFEQVFNKSTLSFGKWVVILIHACFLIKFVLISHYPSVFQSIVKHLLV
jgi:hypothetical protein